MRNDHLIPIDRLRQCLRYEPDTGLLFWKTREEGNIRVNPRLSGKQAMAGISKAGYRNGVFMGLALKAHRVCWALHYGEWPKGIVDHIDRCKTNNRIDNLRVVTQRENIANGPWGDRWRK